MKRTNIFFVTALSATLALGALAGCGKQAQDQAKEQKEEVQEQVQEQTQEALLKEFEDAATKAPAYKSVTVNEESTAEFTGESEEGSGPDSITSKAVYKFDESGEAPKTSSEVSFADIKLKYVTDGDKAVCVTDQGNYAGTADDFALDFAQGFKAYLKKMIGEPKDLVACASEIAKDKQGDDTVWTLKLDPAKYMQTSDVLKMIADSEDPITEETITVTFDKDGNITAMGGKSVFKNDHFSENKLAFSDFDKTTVEALPQADKSFEDYQKDEELKLSELIEESDEAEKTE